MKFSSLRGLTALRRALFAVAVLGCAGLAHAVPITYVFTGSASGSTAVGGLAPVVFSDKLMTVTITTDTTNIDAVRFGTNIPSTNALVSGSISVTGVGSGSFASPLYVFNNKNTRRVGFGDLVHNDLVNVENLGAGLDSYDLASSFGPITGTPPNFVSQFFGVDVGFGLLTLTSLNSATFEATTGAAVPVPQTLALLIAGMGVAGLVRRRRQA